MAARTNEGARTRSAMASARVRSADGVLARRARGAGMGLGRDAVEGMRCGEVIG